MMRWFGVLGMIASSGWGLIGALGKNESLIIASAIFFCAAIMAMREHKND